MKPIWQILQAGQLGATLEAVKTSLGGFTVKMAEDLQKILSNGATFKDNIAAAYIEFDAIHGRETPVANPFRSIPQAFIPISAFTLVGGTNGVGARQDGTQQRMNTQPVLNLSRPDGLLGITVEYAPPFGRIALAKSVNQTGIANNFSTAVTWDVQREVTGGALTHSTSVNTERVVCTVDGVVGFSFSPTFVGRAPALGDWVGSYVAKNGLTGSPGTRHASLRFQSSTSLDQLTSAGVWTVAAGDYLVAYAVQANSVAANRDLQGNSAGETVTDFYYVAPAANTTAKVRGILVEA